MLPWQHLLPGVTEKLISWNQCKGLECKDAREKFFSPRNIVARCCRKANQLQSVQGYGKQRTHKIFISPRNRKKCCHGNLLPGVAEKLISWNQCKDLECKDTREKFLSPRNIKKCCHGNTCCQVCQKTNPLQSVQGYGKQRTHKIFISPRNRKKCCHCNTCCQLSLKN